MHRVENCFGVPLWKSARRYVELWFCFSPVKPHAHPGQHVKIIPLFGWSWFYRVNPVSSRVDSLRISPRNWFRAFSIPAGCRHWFTGTPLVFLNIASTGKSAANNLVYS